MYDVLIFVRGIKSIKLSYYISKLLLEVLQAAADFCALEAILRLLHLGRLWARGVEKNYGVPPKIRDFAPWALEPHGFWLRKSFGALT